MTNAFRGRWFKVPHVLGDGQFETFRNTIEAEGIILNITGRDKHVPEIERYISTVK